MLQPGCAISLSSNSLPCLNPCTALHWVPPPPPLLPSPASPAGQTHSPAPQGDQNLSQDSKVEVSPGTAGRGGGGEKLASGAGSCGRKLSTTRFEKLRPAVAPRCSLGSQRRSWCGGGSGERPALGTPSRARSCDGPPCPRGPEPSPLIIILSPLPCLFVSLTEDSSNCSSFRRAWLVCSLLEDQIFLS